VDFGWPALANEQSWVTASVALSTEVAKIEGGMNAVVREVLRYFLGLASKGT